MADRQSKVTVYQVFSSAKEQNAHKAFLRAASNWNTVTAILLILLFWLYQKIFGANFANIAH